MRRRPMRLIILHEDLYEYLCYVVDSYAKRGIDPREGLSLYHLHRVIRSTPEVDEHQVAKLAVKEDGNASLTVEDAPPAPPSTPAPPDPPACPKCGGREWRPETALCNFNPTGRTIIDVCTKCGHALGGRPSEELNSGDLVGQHSKKYHENEAIRLGTPPPPPASA
jgi:hypothetical protein